MSILTSLVIASMAQDLMPEGMRKDMERRTKQLAKPLKTCSICGEGFNHRGYMYRNCFELSKK